jgi:hypothetical protein
LQLLHSMNLGFPPMSSCVLVQFSHRFSGFLGMQTHLLAQSSANGKSEFITSLISLAPGLLLTTSYVIDFSVLIMKAAEKSSAS